MDEIKSSTDAPGGYITTEQVMEMLHVSRKTVYMMVSDGRLRRAKVGRRNLFKLEDVQAYVDSLIR